MKYHKLKINPDLFIEVREGRKTAEVRRDDRNYQVGDMLHIYPFDSVKKVRTSPDFCCREVTHKVDGGQFGIEKGYCLLSMK